MDRSLPGSFVHGISQARILEWTALSFSRGPSRPRNQSHFFCKGGRFFIIEPRGKPPLPHVRSPNKCWLIVLLWVLQRNSWDYGDWEVLLQLASWKPRKADGVSASSSLNLNAWETCCPSSKSGRENESTHSILLFCAGLQWTGWAPPVMGRVVFFPLIRMLPFKSVYWFKC